MSGLPPFLLMQSPGWRDYALLDSGDGLKLERFGPYTFTRPEPQAIWRRALPENEWGSAHARFQPTGEESGGRWVFKKEVGERWEMEYPLSLPASSFSGTERQDSKPSLRFWAMTTSGRHLGVFPECAAHWDWTVGRIQEARRPTRVLNLFGYTGLATLAAAAAGAQVTHVDASKKSVAWARANQVLSGLADKPVRWIVDDALKFVQREARRGSVYDGILLDPPKFGRGPKGEVWEVYKSLPRLLETCRDCLSAQPLFLVVTIYAVQSSAIHVGQALEAMLGALGGRVESGELVTSEASAGRFLSQAVFARWSGK